MKSQDKWVRERQSLRKLGLIAISFLPSILQVLCLRKMGAQIGTGVTLGLGAVVMAKELYIGDHTKIGPFSFLEAVTLHLGKRVKIGSLVFMKCPRIVVDNDSKFGSITFANGFVHSEAELRVGKRCYIFPFSWLDTSRALILEDEVGVGGGGYIFTHGSWQSVLDGFPRVFAPVTIGKKVWLPWRVTVLPGVTIGEEAIIGSCSVVNRDVPPRCLAAGVPAKVLRVEEHIKELSLNQRSNIFLSILDDYAEFLRYSNITSTTEEKPQFKKLSVATRGGKFILEYRMELLEIPSSHAVAFFQCSAELKTDLIQRRIPWFDLHSYHCSPYGHFGQGSLEFKNFLGGYGIRFEPCDELELRVTAKETKGSR